MKGHERMRKQVNVSLGWENFKRLDRIWRNHYAHLGSLTECGEELICERIHQIEQQTNKGRDNG